MTTYKQMTKDQLIDRIIELEEGGITAAALNTISVVLQDEADSARPLYNTRALRVLTSMSWGAGRAMVVANHFAQAQHARAQDVVGKLGSDDPLAQQQCRAAGYAADEAEAQAGVYLELVDAIEKLNSPQWDRAKHEASFTAAAKSFIENGQKAA